MKQKILELYFEQNLKQIEISDILGVSKYKVSRIVTNDKRYFEEKEKRKNKSKEKHIEDTKKIVKSKRNQEKMKKSIDNLILREMHKQASMELSKGRKLSDMAYRNWNTSAYKYNQEKKRFEFRDELGRSCDIKKYLKGTI